MSDLLTIGQAAKLLAVKPPTVRKYVERGTLACLRLPSGHRRFKIEDVEALLSAAPTEGPS